jgi:hypothetical protein
LVGEAALEVDKEMIALEVDEDTTSVMDADPAEGEDIGAIDVSCCGTFTITVPVPLSALGVAIVNVAIAEPAVV